MKTFYNILDKLLFAALLLLALQVPVLADHYLQYLSGYHDALESQVRGFRGNAVLNGYENVYEMIDAFLASSSPSVRLDGQQKLQTMHEFEELQSGLMVFQEGNILQKSMYMFSPVRFDTLERVLQNFEPGLPLGMTSVVFSLLLAVGINLLFLAPGRGYRYLKKRHGRKGGRTRPATH